MKRYPVFVVFVLFSLPVGLSLQGCATKVGNYCNGLGYGLKTNATSQIDLEPKVTGISVAFGQIGQLQTPTATTCKNQPSGLSTFTYGTTDRTLADVSPTGQVCGGTWNLNTAGVANYTTCLPTSKSGIAYLTASGAGVTSNTVPVYVHPTITSLSLNGPQSCLSQNATGQLNATAYTTDSTGKSVLLCSPDVLADGSYGPTDCNNVIGHLAYKPVDPTVVTIDQNGVATAHNPGATIVTASIANTGSNAGYFFTCPPARITLTLPDGTTSGSVTPNNPQALTANITDINGQAITGLTLDYTTTDASTINVSSAGSITSTFASNAAITAICQPTTCNPAPIEKLGVQGTGTPVVSNSVQITSPGVNSSQIWLASPNSPFFVPVDLTLNTPGTPIKLPYTPNSMVMDRGGSSLYFGSYRELMVYAAATNTLTKEDINVPGVVLAVSPDNSTVVINDQVRQVIYLYTVSSGAFTSFGGLGQRASFTPDGKTLYVVGKNTLYIHNLFTGWSLENLPAGQASGASATCPAANSDPNLNTSFNSFCSPDLAITTPSVAAFLSGAQTAAYSFCPETTATPVITYPFAGSVSATTDHLAATTDGRHIIGASANPPQLTDIAVTVPTGACPRNANGQNTALAINSTFNQTPLALSGVRTIDQVVASPNSLDAFLTYTTAATTAPVGGASLPLYRPSAQPGSLGTVTYIALAGAATAPVAGAFSPDNSLFFAGTSGDNLVHIIDTKALTDTRQFDPRLTDASGAPVPPQFITVKPRPTT